MDVSITDYHTLWQYDSFIFLETQLNKYIGFIRVRKLGEVLPHKSLIFQVIYYFISVSKGDFLLFCVCLQIYKVTLRLSIFLQSKMALHPLALEMEKYWIRPCGLQAR